MSPIIYGGSSGGGSMPVQQAAPVLLSSADLLALNTTPREILPGVPGVILYPLEVVAQSIGGTVGYTLAGNILLCAGDPHGLGPLVFLLPALTNLLQQGSDFVSSDTYFGVGVPAPIADPPGSPLFLFADSFADPTDGDADLWLQVLYGTYAVAA